ncbi:MAG: hypothetical protein AAGG51_29725 [Cyanobacteria bacterium P01_G01_bin.54]
MIVISDTSPLRYLIVIEQIELLPQLFERIVIPEAIANDRRRVWFQYDKRGMSINPVRNVTKPKQPESFYFWNQQNKPIDA